MCELIEDECILRKPSEARCGIWRDSAQHCNTYHVPGTVLVLHLISSSHKLSEVLTAVLLSYRVSRCSDSSSLLPQAPQQGKWWNQILNLSLVQEPKFITTR